MKRNWVIVYAGNFVCALMIAAFVVLSGILYGANFFKTPAAMAQAKLDLTASEALFRGTFCNMLVCLAVWMSYAAHTVTGKVVAVLMPIAAFVAVGFEHSVANMYVVPVAMFEGIVAYDV